VTNRIKLSDEQRQVVDADDPLILVTGSAGTGKTTTALAAAHHALTCEHTASFRRALFLTFSRTAVSQIGARMSADSAYHELALRVDILTFHAFAYQIIRAFGDKQSARLLSRAEAKLLGRGDDDLVYDELVPYALEILQRPHVGTLLRNRWAIVVCDEFQDTNDPQWQLLQLVSGWSRLLVMADVHQTIYDSLPGNKHHRMGQQRLDELVTHARLIPLTAGSFRDSTNIIPAAAEQIRCRKFAHEAVQHALNEGRLKVKWYSGDPEDHCDQVLAQLRQLTATGIQTVGVFLQGNDPVAELSATLADRSIHHSVAGLSEAHSEAIRAMATLIGYAAGLVDHNRLRLRLATFAVASRRRMPPVARMLAGAIPFESRTLEAHLNSLEESLTQMRTSDNLISAVCAFWPSLKIGVGQAEWQRAAGTFRALIRPLLRSPTEWRSIAEPILQRAEAASAEALVTTDEFETAPIRLMNFHQTKGREADATILVFTNKDFFGPEDAPYPDTSRLMYVAFTRARHNVIVLMPAQPHPVPAPLARYCT